MYNDLIKGKELFSLQTPPTIVPVPDSTNYDIGFIERYFIQKANDKNGQVYEVSLDTYDKYVANPYWINVNLKWRITGPLDIVFKENGDVADKGVQNSNKLALDIAAEKIKNIRLYLPNLLQFYRK